MNITLKQEEKDLYHKLVQKAWESAYFKERLITNPETTIEETIGIIIPENHKVVVEDQSDEDTFYLNIPRKVTFNNLELSDEELEQVAGGERRNFGENIGYYGAMLWDHMFGDDPEPTTDTTCEN